MKRREAAAILFNILKMRIQLQVLRWEINRFLRFAPLFYRAWKWKMILRKILQRL